MEAYALALTYAIPIFLALIGIEALISWRMGIKINRGADIISSLGSGITNIVKDVLGLSIAIVSYAWLVNKVAIFHISNVWYVYVIAFVAKDFAGYWIHRLEHTINFMWNRHIIHHSSEEYNLSCALRQSISEVFSFVSLFLLPAALLGVPTEVIAVIAPIQLFAQFWYHTRLIHKMGILEYIIVTPSHHRVHHAINPEYMDKNFSQIFIIWDKMFGTFQPELEEVPAVYGVKRPVQTWNPFLINFRHNWLILNDAWHTSRWWDKIRIWFMPTGWRPEDVKVTHPVQVVEDVYRLTKYDTFISKKLLSYAWFQLIALLVFTMYLFMDFASIGFPGVLIYGLFLMVSVFSITSLLDKAPYAFMAEVIRFLLVIAIIIYSGGDWFKLKDIFSFGPYLVSLFMFISLMMVAYFHFRENRYNVVLPLRKFYSRI
ncbi:MAG TPA: sterol desaturase family protein [Saprospiraceae bacterium]|nr:sterol desaturase family protein [Saprospiraceae bacterium]